MADVKYCLKDPLIPGQPARVKTMDAEGKPTGEYKAYYKPERGTVMLYPAPGSWIYGRLAKHEVSVYLLTRAY